MARPEDSDRDRIRELMKGAKTVFVPTSPYLEPEDSPFSSPLTLVLKEYELIVASTLFKSLESACESIICEQRHRETASLVCIPSHRPEWALWVVGERKTGFSVLWAEAEGNIWLRRCLAKEPKPTSIRKSQSQLPTELGGAICDIWRKVLSETRHPEVRDGGWDGVMYHFGHWSVSTGTRMAGKTWSPPEKTFPGKLVSLSVALKDYALDKGESKRQIVQRIEDHLAWLQTNTPMPGERRFTVIELRKEPPNTPPTPCPWCGKPLRTKTARQCRFCGKDWHTTYSA
jgi:hypothetical protein